MTTRLTHFDYSPGQEFALQYHQWLRSHQYDDAIDYHLDDTSKFCIGTDAQLIGTGLSIVGHEVREGTTILRATLERQTRELGHGIEGLKDSIGEVRDAVSEATEQITSVLYWGFGKIDHRLGIINDSLEYLITLARTPSQVWAYEQFDIARDEAQRHFYPEALVSVTRAINGFGSQPGYKTDYRFHALMGELLLGDFSNNSEQVVNTREAEDAFLLAARYAEAAQPKAAAYLGAGRAAFIAGRSDAGRKHLEQCIALSPRNAQAHYLLARIRMAFGAEDAALFHLSEALYFNPNLSTGAPSEVEFRGAHALIHTAIRRVTDRFFALYRDWLDNFRITVARLLDLRIYGTSFSEEMAEQAHRLRNLSAESQRSAETNTLLGAYNACKMLQAAPLLIQSAFDDFRRAMIGKIQRDRAALIAQKSEASSREQEALGNIDTARRNLREVNGMWIVWGGGWTIVLWVLLLFRSCSKGAATMTNPFNQPPILGNSFADIAAAAALGLGGAYLFYRVRIAPDVDTVGRGNSEVVGAKNVASSAARGVADLDVELKSIEGLSLPVRMRLGFAF